MMGRRSKNIFAFIATVVSLGKDDCPNKGKKVQVTRKREKVGRKRSSSKVSANMNSPLWQQVRDQLRGKGETALPKKG